MKKSVFLLLCIFTSCITFATTINVEVSEFQYSPALVTVNPGDTIHFIWISGIHPTASDEGLWSAFMLDEGHPDFYLHVTFPVGNHGFHCTKHGDAGSGMFGNIIVTNAPLGIGELANPNAISLASTVISNYLRIDLTDTFADKISIYSVTGMEMLTYYIHPGDSEVQMDVANFPTGIYIVAATSKNSFLAARKFMKH